MHVQVLEAMSLEQQLVQEEEELRFLDSKGKKSEDEQLQLEADVDQLLKREQGFRSGPYVRN